MQGCELSAISAGLKRIPQSKRDAGIPCAKTLRANILLLSKSTEVVKIGVGLDLSGLLDLHALQHGHRALLDRHEALRSLVEPQAVSQMPRLCVQPNLEHMQHFQVIDLAPDLFGSQHPMERVSHMWAEAVHASQQLRVSSTDRQATREVLCSVCR